MAIASRNLVLFLHCDLAVNILWFLGRLCKLFPSPGFGLLEVNELLSEFYVLLPTAWEGNVFTCICDSVQNRPHIYSLTAHPCWLLGHSLLRRSRYASYLNAFLFRFILNMTIIYEYDKPHKDLEVNYGRFLTPNSILTKFWIPT